MTDKNNDEFQKFLPNEGLESPPIVYEVPSEVETPYQEKIPSGYDPMSEIELRGRAYRGLSGGRIPWWVLITGWFIFGFVAFAFLIPIVSAFITSGFSTALVMLLPALLIGCIPLMILWRGTSAKLSNKNKNRR
ncbi:hypothetical protein NIES267_64480 [Calothrix parasitica NIES-267]|uniref:Uncharacterized protein n=1 Tax=Calothrix parasitica NIES-267 TaxID=1973488 RepID=A0A1Z4M0G4_9CYAN|nr:hypothetical protein NIES267_64480 [Calothrix parasitica NIES-267]